MTNISVAQLQRMLVEAANDNRPAPQGRDPVDEAYRRGLLHLPDEASPEIANELNFAAACKFAALAERASTMTADESSWLTMGSYRSAAPDEPGSGGRFFTPFGPPKGAEVLADRLSTWRRICRAAGPRLAVVYRAVVGRTLFRDLAPPGVPDYARPKAGRIEVVRGLQHVGTAANLVEIEHIAEEFRRRAA